MKFRASRSPLSYLGGLLALYLFVPIVAFLIRLAQPGDRGFGSPGLWSALWTSVATATVSMAIVALLGIPLAYWLARTQGPLTWLVGLIVQLPLALPPVMSGLVLIYIVGPYTWLGNLFNDELTGTVAGVVLAQTFVAGPFLIVAARTAFAGVDPALVDVAASLGRRPASRFLQVTLRVAAPGIRAGLLMTWLRAIGEYGATVLLAYHPYTLPVFVDVQFSSTGIPGTQAPTALALGVAVVVLLIAEIRIGPRLRRAPVLPPPAHPPRVEPVAVSFDLDVTVGTFRLRVAHQSASNRIAILGPSGAGKSITLRAIAGFLGPQAGSVQLNGDEVAPVRVEDRRVGYVPQGLVMFPGRTAWQQATFAAAPTRRWPPGGCARCGSTAWKAGCPSSCPAASASGSPWPARWPFAPAWSYSTSRSAPWTPRSARSCAARSAACSARTACPPSWSPTTPRKRPCSPTRSSSSTTAGCCRPARGPRCSPARPRPTSPGCSASRTSSTPSSPSRAP